MTTSQRVSRGSILGFAVGVGACAVALIAIPLSFWLSANPWLIFGLAFVGGALLGAGVAPRALRPPRAPRSSAPPSSTHDT